MGPRTLERCPECRGIWLPHAQLKEILDQVSHKVEDDLETVESDGQADIAHTFAPSRLKRKCPSCAEEMGNFKFEETGVWVDTCPTNHGIWLDQGELKLLAQKRQSNGQEHDTGEVMDAVSDLILGSL
jgi:Zn-finger nucleic acid-binding protein